MTHSTREHRRRESAYVTLRERERERERQTDRQTDERRNRNKLK